MTRERIASIVVELPLEKDGAEVPQCAATRLFADALATAFVDMPVLLWDEGFSSQEAEALLEHRPGAGLDLEAVAVCVILDDKKQFAAAAEHGTEKVGPAPPASKPKRRPRPKQ